LGLSAFTVAELPPPNFVTGYDEEDAAAQLARDSYAQFGQEQPDEDDECQTAPSSGRIFTDAEIQADVVASQVGPDGESAHHVEQLLDRAAEETLTPSICFMRAHELLEPRSRNSFKTACYFVDVFNASKCALRNSPVLWHLYVLLAQEREPISETVLLRSPLVQEIRYRCGKEIRKRGLHNFTAYCARLSRRHHSEKRNRCSKP
jgi:hypothetical protein